MPQKYSTEICHFTFCFARIRVYTHVVGFQINNERVIDFCQLVSVCTYVRAQAQKNNPPKKPPLSEKWNQSYSSQFNEMKGDMMKLKVNEASQLIIEELMGIHPSEQKYIKWIAKRLSCQISDLRLLESLDPDDEEGYDIKSFFPAELELQDYDFSKCLIHSDGNQNKQINELRFSNWSIGNVYELQLFGKNIIADPKLFTIRSLHEGRGYKLH